MSIKRPRKRHVDPATAKKLRDELVAFADEFDTSDPAHTEVMLDTHISSLLEQGLIISKKKGNDLHLDDVLEYILKVPETDELIENARLFRNLISSYGGDPTDEDMQEAFGILSGLIETLNGIEGIEEAHGQARIDFK
jgi:hypothetical protein